MSEEIQIAEEVDNYYPVGVFFEKSITIEIPLDRVDSQEEAEKLVQEVVDKEKDSDIAINKLFKLFKAEVMIEELEVVNFAETEELDLDLIE